LAVGLSLNLTATAAEIVDHLPFAVGIGFDLCHPFAAAVESFCYA
jgi:hypothetical protein